MYIALFPCAVIEDDNFSIKVHHGDHFRCGKKMACAGGKIDYVDQCDIDKMSVEEIGEMLKDLAHRETFFYYYLEPGRDLNTGLKELRGGRDVSLFCKYVMTHKLMEIYCDSNSPVVQNYNSESNRSHEQDGCLIDLLDRTGGIVRENNVVGKNDPKQSKKEAVRENEQYNTKELHGEEKIVGKFG